MSVEVNLSKSVYFMYREATLDGGSKGMERSQVYSEVEATELFDKGWKGIQVQFPPGLNIRTWLPVKYDLKTTAAHAVVWRENKTRFIGFYPKHPDTMVMPIGRATNRLTYFCLMEITHLEADESIIFNGKDWFVVSTNGN